MTIINGKLSRFTQKEIDTFFQQAHCALRHAGLTILTAPQQKNFGRILVITSRKIGNAPERNKIRRRIKAIFYENRYYAQGKDCVIIIKKEGILLSFALLQQLMNKAFISPPLS